MADINSYANDLLLDFLDAAHAEIRARLEAEMGNDWLARGVERHLAPDYFTRTREMLDSPMRIVDMGKADEELYGVEHLANIVTGNWNLFGDGFGDRKRTEVYFGEVTELRHNVSHRRPHHMIRRGDLLRFTRNAQILLSALRSPAAVQFGSLADSLEQGGIPWGNQLGGILPPSTEIVRDFVGREREIRKLATWLASDSPQIMIEGYGGSGKSALAYQFAQDVRDGAPHQLQATVWLSAKSIEYVEGEARERRADFDSIESFAHALWAALYDADATSEQASSAGILRELSETPSLVIVDDLDSVLDRDDLASFLLFEMRRSRSKVIYTSRQRVPGLETIEVGGFDDSELASFIRSRGSEYELGVDDCLRRLEAIRSVTDGFPLFVDDLLRHAILDGIGPAIEDWSQRIGDAAREYALRRQLESLGEAARRALIGVSVTDRPVSSHELGMISGFTDDDVQYAIRDLLGWRLLMQLEPDDAGRPTFSCNRNTRRLVQKTYGRDPLYASYQATFKTLTGSAMPQALRKAVGIAISNAKYSVLRGDYDGAAEELRVTMTGELANNSDLHGVLGWVLSRKHTEDSIAQARYAFQRAHALGSRKEDTYFQWVTMEREVADRGVGQVSDDELLERWRAAARVVELGVERCGETPSLCQIAAYLRTREGKTLERLREFTSSEACYRQAVDWAKRAIATSAGSSRTINRAASYRSLVIALESLGDPSGTIQALVEWRSIVGDGDPDWRSERDRLARIPEYREISPSLE